MSDVEQAYQPEKQLITAEYIIGRATNWKGYIIYSERILATGEKISKKCPAVISFYAGPIVEKREFQVNYLDESLGLEKITCNSGELNKILYLWWTKRLKEGDPHSRITKRLLLILKELQGNPFQSKRSDRHYYDTKREFFSLLKQEHCFHGSDIHPTDYFIREWHKKHDPEFFSVTEGYRQTFFDIESDIREETLEKCGVTSDMTIYETGMRIPITMFSYVIYDFREKSKAQKVYQVVLDMYDPERDAEYNKQFIGIHDAVTNNRIAELEQEFGKRLRKLIVDTFSVDGDFSTKRDGAYAGLDVYPNVKIIVVKTEEELLNVYAALQADINPDIIVGHNSYGYDFPIVCERMVSNYGSNDKMLDMIRGPLHHKHNIGTIYSYVENKVRGDRNVFDPKESKNAFNAPNSTNHADSMLTYAQLNVTAPVPKRGWGLNGMMYDVFGDDFPSKEDVNLRYSDIADIMYYNIVDSELIFFGEVINKNLETLMFRSASFGTRFSKALKKGVSIRNLTDQLMSLEGFQLSNNRSGFWSSEPVDIILDESEIPRQIENKDVMACMKGLKGGFTSNPLKFDTIHVSKIKAFFKKAVSYLRGVGDVDYTAMYPSVILLIGIAPDQSFGCPIIFPDIFINEASWPEWFKKLANNMLFSRALTGKHDILAEQVFVKFPKDRPDLAGTDAIIESRLLEYGDVFSDADLEKVMPIIPDYDKVFQDVENHGKSGELSASQVRYLTFARQAMPSVFVILPEESFGFLDSQTFIRITYPESEIPIRGFFVKKSFTNFGSFKDFKILARIGDDGKSTYFTNPKTKDTRVITADGLEKFIYDTRNVLDEIQIHELEGKTPVCEVWELNIKTLNPESSVFHQLANELGNEILLDVPKDCRLYTEFGLSQVTLIVKVPKSILKQENAYGCLTIYEPDQLADDDPSTASPWPVFVRFSTEFGEVTIGKKQYFPEFLD